jgi:hypothetical protein
MPSQFAHALEGDVQLDVWKAIDPEQIGEAPFLVHPDHHVDVGASHLPDPRAHAWRPILLAERIASETYCQAHRTNYLYS